MLLLVLMAATAGPGVIYPQGGDSAAFELAKKDFTRGLVHYNRMQYLAAVEFFRKAVSRYPDYHTAREFLARSYKLSGFSQAARREWSSLLDSAPRNVAVMAKIETLKYRDTGMRPAEERRDLVYVDTYKSRNFPRFNFLKPVDIAVDDNKRLYITSFDTGKLVVIDNTGQGDTVVKPSLSGRIYGVDVRAGRAAVSDFTGDRVLVLDRKGKTTLEFGKTGSAPGAFHGPEGVCFDRDGNIYVADSGNCRVQKFDSSGKFILSFGRKGRYEEELDNPTDVAVLGDVVYVSDGGNKRVARFDDSGNFIDNILEGELVSPRGITASAGSIIIADERKGYLIYRPEQDTKEWFASWGDDNKRFARPVASAVDREGYFYCLDHDRDSVYLFLPAQKIYTNLDVDITAVDADRFPVMAFYVNVRDRRGDPVYGLKPSNFAIIEDGAVITNHSVDYIKERDRSASMVLCVDRSQENSPNHNDIPWVAEFILKKMHKNDSLKVLNFNREIWTGNDFDWSRRRALKAIGSRDYARGKKTGAALYNALGDLAGKLSRRGIILVTDGSVDEDSFTPYTAYNVIQYAREHFIPVYVVAFREPDATLAMIARETGGGCYRASNVDSLRKIYDRIRDAEEHRYVVVYSTHKKPSMKGYWSDVRMEVSQKGQKGVEWGGYYVP